MSNRLEKVSDTEPIVIRLEAGGLHVIKSDWTRFITEDLRQGTAVGRTRKVLRPVNILRTTYCRRGCFNGSFSNLMILIVFSDFSFVQIFESIDRINATLCGICLEPFEIR